MIEQIPNLPENVFGFKAIGKVTAKDYETVLMPAVEALFAKYDKVRMLYQLGEEYEGFELGAAWDDTLVGFKHLKGWEKLAVVSDVEWLRGAVKVFALVIHGQVRAFHNRELDEAIRWISE